MQMSESNQSPLIRRSIVIVLFSKMGEHQLLSKAKSVNKAQLAVNKGLVVSKTTNHILGW